MADIVSNPNKLTTKLLREALTKYDVPLPKPNARKSEYVDLYKKYLIDRPQKLDISGGFSSDDEVVIVSQKSNKRVKRKSFGRKVESFALDEKLQYVEGLSDVQLRKELKYLGETIGPVTGSTRSIYQKKLATLMLTPKKMVEEEDNEEEEEEMEVEEPAEQEEEEEEQYSDSEPEIKPTPSARGDAVMSRLRPRSTVTTQTEVRRVTRQSQSNAVQRTQQTKAKKTQWKRLIPIWVQILLFLLLAAFIFLVWYNMETVPALPFYGTPELETANGKSDPSPV